MASPLAKKLAGVRNMLETRRRHRSFLKNKPLQELYARFQSSPEGRWIIGKNDALALWEMMEKYKPKNILELGAGIGASAAVMAMARGTEARITTIEQYEKCIRIARELTPPRIAKNIQYVYTPTHAWQDERISPYVYFSGYQELPIAHGPFDLLIIDGPGYWREGDHLVKLPNGDLFHLIPHLAPGAKIYIDGRKSALTLYKRFLKPYLHILEENKKYALLERTAEPAISYETLTITDGELVGRLTNGTYFHD